MRLIPLILFGLAGVIGLLLEGRHLELHSAIPLTQQEYPWEGVATHFLFMLLEVALVWFILRPSSYAYSWGRAICALVVVTAAVAYWGAGIMHQPDYYFFHLKWLLVFWAILCILFLASSGGALKRRLTTTSSKARKKRAQDAANSAAPLM